MKRSFELELWQDICLSQRSTAGSGRFIGQWPPSRVGSWVKSLVPVHSTKRPFLYVQYVSLLSRLSMDTHVFVSPAVQSCRAIHKKENI